MSNVKTGTVLYRAHLAYWFRDDSEPVTEVEYEQWKVIGRSGRSQVKIKNMRKDWEIRRMKVNARHPFAHTTKEAALEDLIRRKVNRRIFLMGELEATEQFLKDHNALD